MDDGGWEECTVHCLSVSLSVVYCWNYNNVAIVYGRSEKVVVLENRRGSEMMFRTRGEKGQLENT